MEESLEQIIEAIALYARVNVCGCDVLIDRIEDPENSSGRCYETSEEFLAWFRRNYWAEDTTIVHCWGLKPDFGESHAYATSMRWHYMTVKENRLQEYKDGTYHVVVRIGEYYIDLTGAQFGEQYGGAMIYDEEGMLEMWGSLTEQMWELVAPDQSFAYA
jgi:hypothetical protein